ncbi:MULTISPECIES: extracellular solute-binding protein [unclassified Chelatococcus]|uniref:extracellular solute-binding protein n=1 Tax=unclassified Chelatococcus TaxID=2638111 RepID=UPI001BCF9087|nr:extracellular solute-binding protein [Chelatococcus sp.]MBS7700300.1 extracellular solute-binding protein [Chelatococcus sp. YT9]MBX3558271.1 extracellular solute-binding protein [Chelatococcus sp.]
MPERFARPIGILFQRRLTAMLIMLQRGVAMIKMCRRLLFGALTVFTTVLALDMAVAQQTELVINSFGGAYDQALAESLSSFEAENDVKVRLVPAEGADTIVKVRNKEVDILISDPLFALRLESEGAFSKLNPDLVTNLKDLYPQARYSDFTVAANFGGYIIAYSPDRVSDAPQSWFDLARPEFAGRLALRNFRPESIDLITLFAKLAGGDERNPDAGFRQMAKIAENVHAWVNSHAEVLQLYRNGEIDASIWTDGRIAWANDTEKVKVVGAVPKEGFFPLSSTMSIVAGRPNGELIQKLVNHLLSPRSGIIMATRLGYFPTNSRAELPKEVAAKLVINRENIARLQTADWKYIVTVYDEWQRRWDREVVR